MYTFQKINICSDLAARLRICTSTLRAVFIALSVFTSAVAPLSVQAYSSSLYADHLYGRVASIQSWLNTPLYELSDDHDSIYQRIGEGEGEYFDGLEYFKSEYFNKNPEAFPNKTFIPITMGALVTFVPSDGVTTPALGSPYVMRSVISKQSKELLNRSWVGNFPSPAATPDEQIKALYQNGIEFGSNRSLGFSQALSTTDIAHLTKDILWPELFVINGQFVLVPVLYVTASTYATKTTGNTVSFGTASLDYDTILIKNAKVIARRDAFFDAKKDFTLQGGSIEAGDDIRIHAGRTISNLSGYMSANELSFVAENFVNKTLVIRHDHEFGYSEQAQQLAVIEAIGDINIETAEDVLFEGAQAHADGDIRINAGGSVQLVTTKVREESSQSGSFWSQTEQSLTNIISELSADDIAILAGEEILLEAASIEAEGSLELLAGMGIYVLDAQDQYAFNRELNIKTSGVFGTKTTEKEQIREVNVLRAVLKSGRDVSLRTLTNNIVLRSIDLEAQGVVAFTADDGQIALTISKEIDSYSYESFDSGALTFRSKGNGHYIETAAYNQILAHGGLLIDAKHGIQVEYGVKDGDEDDIDAIVSDLAQTPSLAWMKQVRNEYPADWGKVQLAYDEWDYSTQGLTEAGAALLSVVMAAATGGAGAALFEGAITSAVAQAAVTTLATQAASTLYANNGDIGQTFKDLGSKQNIKALLTSMATAGLLEQFSTYGIEDTKEVVGAADTVAGAANTGATAIHWVDQAQNMVAHATIKAGVEVLANGGDIKDLGESFIKSMATDSVAKIGRHYAQKIGAQFKGTDGVNTPTSTTAKYIAHAALGCAYGAALANISQGSGSKGCSSGATGAVVGEVTQEIYNQVTEVSEEILSGDRELTKAEVDGLVKRLQNLETQGLDLAKFTAGLTAAYSGGDVNIAITTGENAAKNNALFLIPVIIGLLKAADAALIAVDVYKLGKALNEGNDEAAQEIMESLATDLAIGAVFGSATFAKGLELLINKVRDIPGMGKVLSDLENYLEKVVTGNTGDIEAGHSSVNSVSGVVKKTHPDHPLTDDALPRSGVRKVTPQGSVPTCGQHSCAMMANADGYEIDPMSLIKQTGEVPTTRLDIQALLHRNGVDAVAETGASIKDLTKHTESGSPVMAMINGPNRFNHWVVVDGITKRNGIDVVAIRDPHGQQYFSRLSTFLNYFISGDIVRMK